MAELIYRAGFKTEALEPADGSYASQLGALRRIQAPAEPGLVQSLSTPASPHRAVMTVTRPPTLATDSERDNCYVGALVQNFPRSIDYFKVRATFELPAWESPATNFGWAAAIFYRSENADDWPYSEERATLTMRSQATDGERAGRLNMPGATNVEGGRPGTVPSAVYDAIYETGVRQLSMFTLELLVDRKKFGVARGRLEARARERSEFPDPPGSPPSPPSWRPYLDGRWFTHPVISANMNKKPDPIGLPDPTHSVGFALAIASSNDSAKAPVYGKATITISDFSVYRLSLLEVLVARWGMGWLERLFVGSVRG